MKRDAKIFLADIIDSIEKIGKYLNGVNEESFCEDEKLQDAVVRRIEIIGEAVKGVPIPIRQKFFDVNWRELAGMRDVVIHQYFGVNLKRVWNAAKEELPLLREKLIKIMDQLGGQALLFDAKE